jgi:hypothetical protein
MAKPILRTVSVAVALVALLLAPVPAHASGGDVIRDCSEDGSLDKHYSQRELSGALDNLPSDLDEYTDCRTVIRRAQLAGAKGKEKKGRPGVLDHVDRSSPINPDEQRSLDEATGSSGPVHIGGRPIRPGAAGATFAQAGLGTDLPSSVLISLIGLGAVTLLGAGYAVRRRWPEAWAGAGTPFRRMSEGVRRGISRLRR